MLIIAGVAALAVGAYRAMKNAVVAHDKKEELISNEEVRDIQTATFATIGEETLPEDVFKSVLEYDAAKKNAEIAQGELGDIEGNIRE